MAGGMAAVFSTLIKTCFVDNDLSDVGLVLNRDGRPPTRVFARLGCFVQDGAAHKSTWHCKGDAGSKICILCRNLFSARSELCDEDGGELLHCNARRRSDLDVATNEELREAVRRLEHFKAIDRAATFELRQMALGFTHVPYSMLSDATLDPHLRVADQFMHDWMHMVFVTGVWNVVLNMLLESLRKVKHDIYAVVRNYVEQWRWPASLRMHKFSQLFADTRRAPNAKAHHFTCSAIAKGCRCIHASGHLLA